jgi:SAM-dependent methyltransferase
MARQGVPRERTREAIRAFWDGEARELGRTPKVSIRDLYFRVHELHTLLPLVPRGSRVLDAGCGTGLGTLVLGGRARYVLGIDSSSAMLSWAARLRDDPAVHAEMSSAFPSLWVVPKTGAGHVEFVEADVLDLRLPAARFDVINAQRLLINMPSVSDQLTALRNLRRHATDRALLILGETTEQGYLRTDAYRARYGLSKLERHWHNLYLDEAQLGQWTETGWRVEFLLGFDTYMLLSKVVYPAACGEEHCRFLSGSNAAAMEMACLFRTKCAVDELGAAGFMKMYVERVAHYDASLGAQISAWIDRHGSTLGDWRDLGHQRVIVARAV